MITPSQRQIYDAAGVYAVQEGGLERRYCRSATNNRAVDDYDDLPDKSLR